MQFLLQYNSKTITHAHRGAEQLLGVKGNGKYSKYDLELQEIDITEPQKKTAYWRDINAQTQLLETDQGKPRFVVIFDVDRPINELTKTIAHELAGHLYNYESVLKLYEDTKDFQKANFEFFKKKAVNKNIQRWKIRNTKKLISINKL